MLSTGLLVEGLISLVGCDDIDGMKNRHEKSYGKFARSYYNAAFKRERIHCLE